LFFNLKKKYINIKIEFWLKKHIFFTTEFIDWQVGQAGASLSHHRSPGQW
jgi:hypothetical protein